MAHSDDLLSRFPHRFRVLIVILALLTLWTNYRTIFIFPSEEIVKTEQRETASAREAKATERMTSYPHHQRNVTATDTTYLSKGVKHLSQQHVKNPLRPLPPQINSVSCQIGNETHIFPEFPSFILIGAQKAGTSALHGILKQVPSIYDSARFEPHFFDMRQPKGYRNKDPFNYTEEDICYLRHAYYMDNFHAVYRDAGKLNLTPTLTFEKTPVYMTRPIIATKIASIFYPKPKLLVILRDPVDRAFALYRHSYLSKQRVLRNELIAAQGDAVQEAKVLEKARTNALPPFEKVISKDMGRLRRMGGTSMPPLSDWSHQEDESSQSSLPPPDLELDNYRDSILRGLYARQLKPFLNYWTLDQDIKVLTFDELRQDPSQLLTDVLEFVGAGSVPHNMTDQDLRNDFSPVQQVHSDHANVTFEVPILDNRTRAYLKHFYQPYNAELAELLGDDRYRTIWS